MRRHGELSEDVEHEGGGDEPSLDQSTQLGDSSGASGPASGWTFTNWPECAEASLAWISPGGSLPKPGFLGELRNERLAERGSPEHWREPDHFERARQELEAEREAMTWARANGRAASKSRRYFVRNSLRYMWVLTFACEQFERRQVMEQVSDFARRLREALGAAPLPYWYSPELHPGGHGWHVNFFVSNRIAHELAASVWGHGFVWVTDFAVSPAGPKGEPLGLCRSPREGWRRAAGYGCKYAQKDWSPEHVGQANHRYEVAQGFAPVRRSQWVSCTAEAEGLVLKLVPPEATAQLRVWDSGDSPDWNRPPVRTWRW